MNTALWTRDRGMLSVAALAVVVLVTYGLELVPSGVGAAAGWLVLIPIHAVEARLSLRIAALPTTTRAGRRFWRLLAAAAASFCAAAVAQAGYAVTRPYPRYPAAISGAVPYQAFLALGAGFLILAMLTSPLGLASKRERTRFWLDAATVMICVGLFAWQLSDPTLAGTTNPHTGELVAALLGPAAFIVVAFGAAKIVMGGTAVFTPVSGTLGGLAALIEGVGMATAPSLLASGHTGWLLGYGLMANVVFVAGLRAQYVETRARPAASRGRDRATHSRLPYVAIAASYGLLVRVLLEQSLSTNAWVILGGAILSSALVVARQLAAFADNDDLLAQLNAKVGELADARDVLQRALGERDMLSDRLRHLAYHDSLTGLANRALFLERLTEALTTTRPTVMIIDLDDFKPVNDTHGHHAGDLLLRATAERLTQCVGAAGTVARLGGDEFAILLPQPTDISALRVRVAAAVAEPLPVGTTTVRVGASIGAATAPDDRAEPAVALTELLHRADLAMYADKQRKPATRAAA